MVALGQHARIAGTGPWRFWWIVAWAAGVASVSLCKRKAASRFCSKPWAWRLESSLCTSDLAPHLFRCGPLPPCLSLTQLQRQGARRSSPSARRGCQPREIGERGACQGHPLDAQEPSRKDPARAYVTASPLASPAPPASPPPLPVSSSSCSASTSPPSSGCSSPPPSPAAASADSIGEHGERQQWVRGDAARSRTPSDGGERWYQDA